MMETLGFQTAVGGAAQDQAQIWGPWAPSCHNGLAEHTHQPGALASPAPPPFVH